MSTTFDPIIYRKKKRARRRRFTRAWVEQSGRCFYCRWPMLHPDKVPADARSANPDPLIATEDHKIPQSRYAGNKDDARNIVLACHTCNQKKKDNTDAEFETSHRRWLFQRRLEALTFGFIGSAPKGPRPVNPPVNTVNPVLTSPG